MTRSIRIGDRVVGDGEPVYIAAEIGINHNGDLEIARRLIDVAARSGCDAVKFQKRTPDRCVPADQRDVVRNTPWGVGSSTGHAARPKGARASPTQAR